MIGSRQSRCCCLLLFSHPPLPCVSVSSSACFSFGEGVSDLLGAGPACYDGPGRLHRDPESLRVTNLSLVLVLLAGHGLPPWGVLPCPPFLPANQTTDDTRRKGHRDGGGGGVEELGQRLLEHPDAGIDGGKCTVDNRARAARGMFTEEASASPLTLTAREQVPKFADLLWHCFGGASRSLRFRGLRIRLLRPHRAPHRHLGKKNLLRLWSALPPSNERQFFFFWVGGGQLLFPRSKPSALPCHGFGPCRCATFLKPEKLRQAASTADAHQDCMKDHSRIRPLRGYHHAIEQKV